MNGTLYFIVIGTATLLLLLFPTWFANRLNCKRPTISNGEGNKRRGSEQHEFKIQFQTAKYTSTLAFENILRFN